MKYTLQIAVDSHTTLPSVKKIEDAISLMSENFALGDCSLTLRITTEAEIQSLNQIYRGRDYPTNILSFANEADENFIVPGIALKHLGDLVLCHGVIVKEAEMQNKVVLEHYMHLVIHGILHLLGYDHEMADEALEMESLEIAFLKELKIDNPYEE